ncbi:predicted P29 [Mycoplasmopsis fermentans JER]|nr:predicted P29 [Mycoplasmopsis fermentans JER]
MRRKSMNKKFLKLGSIAGILSFAPVAISAGCGSKGGETPTDSLANKKALVEQALKDLNAKIETVADGTKKAELKKEVEAIKKDFDAAKTIKDFEAVDAKIKKVAAKVESGSTSEQDKYKTCFTLGEGKDRIKEAIEAIKKDSKSYSFAYDRKGHNIVCFKGQINWKSGDKVVALNITGILKEHIEKNSVQLANAKKPTYNGKKGEAISSILDFKLEGNTVKFSFKLAKFENNKPVLDDPIVYNAEVSLA